MFAPRSEHTKMFISDYLNLMKDFLDLLKNPKALEEIVKSAHALNDSEQRAVAASRQYIQDANTLRSELKSKENELQKLAQEVDHKSADSYDRAKANSDLAVKLEKRQLQLEQREKEHKLVESRHAEERAILEKRQTDLAQKEIALNRKAKENEEFAEKLKKRAEILRSGTEGL